MREVNTLSLRCNAKLFGPRIDAFGEHGSTKVSGAELATCKTLEIQSSGKRIDKKESITHKKKQGVVSPA